MKNNPAISIASRGLPRTIASVLLALWLSPATLSVGQDSEPEKSQAKASEKAGKKEEPSAGAKKKAEQAKAKKDMLAIVGADIVTVTQETIRRGTILIEDGKFSKVGTNIEVPSGATIIDAEGKVVAPGFVAINASRVGLRTSSDRSAKYADGLDPFDRNVSLSLGVGITTACLQVRTGGGGFRRRAPDEEGFPSNDRFIGLDPDEHDLTALVRPEVRDIGDYRALCPCCNLPILPTEPITPSRPAAVTPQKNAVIKMSFGDLDGMLVAENVFVDVLPGALSGATNRRTWRKQLADARKYIEDQAAHEKATAAGKKDKPPRKPVSDEIIRLAKKECALRINADSAKDLQSILEIVNELDIRVVLAGAGESWVVASQLSEADAGIVLTPRARRSPTFGAEDRTGTWIETPRVLQEAGVPFAVSTLSSSISLNGLAGRDLTSLPLEAAFAVRGGASERKALAAITIVPATMMGLDDRIGSIEEGKDADLVILNGPALDYRTYVETALVNGRVAYERARDRVLPVYDRQ